MKMRLPRLSLLVYILALANLSIAQSDYLNPIEGDYGKDFIIANYVDWGFGTAINDNHCLTKTYDGHQGTDFVIRNFALMDSGINVLAVDSGVVIFTHDGEFDREKVSVLSKGLGNYIGITHEFELQTYYGHLKNGSILVEEGDTVVAGQVIGQVASSGNSTDPHLHFELWYDSTFYIDPFSGPCGNATAYWANEIPFDSSFNVWTGGLWNYTATLDTLREEPPTIDTIFQEDEAVSFWTLMYGLRNGDSLTTKWFTPANVQYSEFSYAVDQDWWYYYHWNEIAVPDTSLAGDWTVKLYRNNVEIDNRNFWLYNPPADTDTTVVDGIDHVSSLISVKTTYHGNYVELQTTELVNWKVYDLHGRLAQSSYETSRLRLSKSAYPAGIYLVHMLNVEGEKRAKKVLIE
ncbi:MAG: peptidoglycan DD-metalloendopeptidase family protein [Flavobacteriales bacterium]|nr:peptidoglycan DD-metalloendopeptidase family protein [Flavobacteriales bacterium]